MTCVAAYRRGRWVRHRSGERSVARQRQDGVGDPRGPRSRVDAAALGWRQRGRVRRALRLARPGVRVRDRLPVPVLRLHDDPDVAAGPHGRGAVPHLRVPARAVPGLRRRRDARAPLREPALADVVPRGAVLLAADDAGVPRAPGRGRRRGRGGDQPGRGPVGGRHPGRRADPRPAAVLRARPAPDSGTVSAVFDAGRRRLAAAVLLGVGVLAIWTDRLASTEWLYYRARYAASPSATPGRCSPGRRDPRRRCRRVGLPHAAAAGDGLVHPDGHLHAGRLPLHGFVVLGAEFAGVPAWAGAPRPGCRRRQRGGRRPRAAPRLAAAGAPPAARRRPVRPGRARGPQGRRRDPRSGY